MHTHAHAHTRSHTHAHTDTHRKWKKRTQELKWKCFGQHWPHEHKMFLTLNSKTLNTEPQHCTETEPTSPAESEPNTNTTISVPIYFPVPPNGNIALNFVVRFLYRLTRRENSQQQLFNLSCFRVQTDANWWVLHTAICCKSHASTVYTQLV